MKSADNIDTLLADFGVAINQHIVQLRNDVSVEFERAAADNACHSRANLATQKKGKR